MERKERRHHTREFKLEAVRLAAVGDKTKAKVARELGVRVNQLRQWRLDFEEEERNGVPKQELATAEQDLGTLRIRHRSFRIPLGDLTPSTRLRSSIHRADMIDESKRNWQFCVAPMMDRADSLVLVRFQRGVCTPHAPCPDQ